jgi:hypothetical protein
VEAAVAAGHRVHGATTDHVLFLTVPAGARVAADLHELARVPYVPGTLHFTIEDAPVLPAAALAAAGATLLVALPERHLALYRVAEEGAPLPAAVNHAAGRLATVHTLAPHPFRPASRSFAFPAGVARRDNVADLIARVSVAEIEKYVTYLSGEAQGSPFTTRQAQSDPADAATEWVAAQWSALGYVTTRPSFSVQYCPNVVGEWRGTREPERYVVVGAHLDDRAQNIADPAVRAPVRALS